MKKGHKIFRGKKGMDTRALDLIIVTPIIAIVILIFYIFLGQSLIEKQQTIIEGDMARFNIDKTLADWVYEEPQDFLSTEKMERGFAREFQEHGFIIEDIDCEPNRCEFELKRGKEPAYEAEYQRAIYLPGTQLKEIRFVGTLQYELQT